MSQSPDQGDEDEEEEAGQAPSDDDADSETNACSVGLKLPSQVKAARPTKERRVAGDESGSDDLSFTEDESSSEESSDDGGAGITRDWFLKRFVINSIF